MSQPPYPPPPQGWGMVPPPPPTHVPPYWGRPDHPQATTAMVLGIVGLAAGIALGLPLVICPVAWVIGHRAVREIDASGGALGGRSSAMTGMVLGIVGTVFLVVGTIFVAIYLTFIGAAILSAFG